MRWMIAFGWSVFALLTVVIGLQFLLACDFHFLGFERKTCLPRESNDGLRIALERQEALLREVHAAELRIAAKPVCLPVAEVKPPDAIQKRAYDRGAKQGKLEVFLDWNTLDDMDLSIGCPGGVIGGLKGKPGPGVCGDGKLDLDANRDLRINVASNPVEHVVWQDDIPAGDYSFEVYMFRVKDTTRELNVPFRLRIRLDDQERVCSGAIPRYPRSQNRRNASGKIIGGKNLSLQWSYGQPLPECNFVSVDTTYCDAGECDKN